MARAIRVRENGGPEVLQMEEVSLGDPGPGECLISQSAVGVNFIDTYHRSGLYPVGEPPYGIGVEAAGVVEAVGENVDEVAVGDRVAYAGGSPGAYADARVVPARILVRIPEGIDDHTAAAMMLRGMTVEYLIRRTFPVEPGMTVLWHAAAGGVGSIACQWLAHLGVTVIGTVRGDEKARRARELGCAYVIDYSHEDFVERVKEITEGRGVPVVYDGVGKATFEGSLACLARRGMLVTFGNASGAVEPIEPLRLSPGSLYMTRPRLFDYVATRDELLGAARALFEVVERGAVAVEPGKEWPLERAADAHRALEGRETKGSPILVTRPQGSEVRD